MPFLKYREMYLKEYTFFNENIIIEPMSSSSQSTTMSLEQAKTYCHKVVTKYLTYFPISQIVSRKGLCFLTIC